MKGRQAARIAAGLAAEVEASLLRAGCVPPPREDLAGALWPFARNLARSRKMLRRAEAFRRMALGFTRAAEAQCLDAMAAVADAWARGHPPAAPVQALDAFAGLDPVAWAEQVAREAA